MPTFHVYIDKRDIKEDGSICVEIDDWDIQDSCADMGGCCTETHGEVLVGEFKTSLDHYFFQNSLDQGELYREILRMAGYTE